MFIGCRELGDLRLQRRLWVRKVSCVWLAEENAKRINWIILDILIWILEEGLVFKPGALEDGFHLRGVVYV